MLPKMAGWGGVKAIFISDLKAILPLYRILGSEAPHTAISCGLVIKETLPISIFLALSTVNKVSYRFYRRGCPKHQSTVLFSIKLNSAVCTKFVETLLKILRV